MLRWSSLAEVPLDIGPCVVTLGNFDGVHRGHQAVIDAVMREADGREALGVAVTFEPHPLAVLFPDRAPARLTGAGQRERLLTAYGIDAVLTLEFTRDFAAQTPREFVESVFVRALRAVAVVVGRDTRFGVKNSGDVHTLRDLGAELGFEVVVLDDIGQEHVQRWSSSAVREAVLAGEMEPAAGILGHLHRVEGIVVHGDHRGRELGYPTANLAPDAEGLVPPDGVYAGWLIRHALVATHADHRTPAAISIGTNPTFDGTTRRVEAYVIDRTDLDLYGEDVTIEFVRRLRPTLKFTSVDDLVDQMAIDVAQCRDLLT